MYEIALKPFEALTARTFEFASADGSKELAVRGSAAVVIATEQPLGIAAGPGTESSITRLNASLEGGEWRVRRCP